jgi:AraC-like DNA-binding protein
MHMRRRSGYSFVGTAAPCRSKAVAIEPISGRLTALQLGRVKEFIDSHSNDVTISDLAAVVGLSQFHFIRAFKDSVGLSPY